ncbi:hypothetical protein [Pseudochryseolinea flava]|uniref:Uncharacterized protein n=1 Tax=Pseudochryseolinea flava TaxID=2059302 RepID=A0A364Y3E8_9BACT|nr:hypothetical protein [Pseudochryseolinea flava]RAW01242.1 hypothetical protein DQQ10_10035 [Pseudochryseolinea flava]
MNNPPCKSAYAACRDNNKINPIMRGLSKLGVFLLIMVLGCTGRNDKPEIVKSPPDEKVDEQFKSVLLSPEKFDGVELELTGIFRYESENVAIYLTNKDSDSLISSNAFWVNSDSLSDAKLRLANRKKVHLKGRFDKDHTGHLNSYSGTINEVKDLDIQ